MNKFRRQWIEKVINLLEEQRDELSNIQESEQEAFDNMPESLQYSERGDEMQDNVDTLDEAYNDIDNVISNLTDLINK